MIPDCLPASPCLFIAWHPEKTNADFSIRKIRICRLIIIYLFNFIFMKQKN